MVKIEEKKGFILLKAIDCRCYLESESCCRNHRNFSKYYEYVFIIKAS